MKLFLRKIIDDNYKIVGYYSNNKVYDVNYELWGYIRNNKFYVENKLVGYKINHKLYYNNDIYIGKIQNIIFILLFLIMITVIILVGLALTFSLDNDNNDYIEIEVTTSNGVWGKEEEIDLLYNQYAGKDKDGNNLIAPGSTNKSKFSIYNKNDYTVNYMIEFVDNNVDNRLPIKYKLKLNDKYIAGNENNWLYLSEISSNNLELSGKEKAKFEIEWKWDELVSNYNDTKYGIEGKEEYKIDIIISEIVTNKK